MANKIHNDALCANKTYTARAVVFHSDPRRMRDLAHYREHRVQAHQLRKRARAARGAARAPNSTAVMVLGSHMITKARKYVRAFGGNL